MLALQVNSNIAVDRLCSHQSVPPVSRNIIWQ